MLLVLSVTSFISNQRRRKLRLGGQPEEEQRSTARLRSDGVDQAWTRFLAFVEGRGLPLTDTKGSKLSQNLAAAGFTHPAALRLFTFIRLILAIGLPAAVITLGTVTGTLTSIFSLYLCASIAGLLGLYLPNLFVTARADRRREQLVKEFPDALDLLLVCVEAGLGLDAAFDRVGREFAQSRPLLAGLFAQLVFETRAGRSREEALQRMADTAGVDEVRTFSTLLIQSTRLGSSVSQALRTYASEMRERRRMRAEEKAHRLPVLISLPLVGCMLPVMIGVLMLPAAIRAIRAVLPALGGE
jgi:tight adherence protein C